MKLSMAGMTLAVLAVLAGPAQAKDRYDVGEPVPAFTLKVVNEAEAGEKYVSLDKFFGDTAKEKKKATIVSFFATYCAPCKKEMPYLAALYDHYRDKGLQILLVTIDKEAEKIDEAKALAKEAAVKFPVLSDRFNIVARRYFIEKLPCVYILNAEGKVALVNVGYSDDVTKGLLDAIRGQLGEPLSDPVPEALKKYMEHGKTTVASAASDGKLADTAPSGDDSEAEDASEGGEDEVEDDDKGDPKKRKGRKSKRRKKRR